MTDSEIILIETKDELKSLTEKIIDNKINEIAVDFEGESNLHRYGIHLCLIQLYDGDKCYIIDPIKIKNISSMKEIFEDENICKVMYSADFDVRLLDYTVNYHIHNIFDLQIGAKMLGYEDISLKHLISDILDKTIDKSKKNQRSNWNRRPLSGKQISYAAGDVKYLLDIMKNMKQRLKESDMTDTFLEKNRSLEKVRFVEKSQPYMAIKNSKQISREAKIYLKNFFYTRDKIAKNLDFPPFWVMSNELLVAISQYPPSDREEWLNIKGLSIKAFKYVSLFEDASKMSKKEIEKSGKNPVYKKGSIFN